MHLMNSLKLNIGQYTSKGDHLSSRLHESIIRLNHLFSSKTIVNQKCVQMFCL